MNDADDLTVSPNNLEAERACLGSMLESQDALDDVADRLTARDFYRRDHGALFDLLLSVAGSGQPVDLVTVTSRISMMDEGGQERVGGLAYVMDLPDHVVSVANVIHYADLVKASARRRRLQAVLRDGLAAVVRDPSPPAQIRDLLVADLLEEEVETAGAKGWQRADDSAGRFMEHLDRAREAGGLAGSSWGFHALDARPGRLLPTNLIVLASRPGMGKTSLALDVAEAVCVADGPVAMFSLEMSELELTARMVAKRCSVPYRLLLENRYEDADAGKIADAAHEVANLDLFVDDTPALSIGEIRSRARALKRRHPDLALIILDYLQLVRGTNPRAPRSEQVAEVSGVMKQIAKELNVPVLALAQLNRTVEDRKDRRPILSDLRESGAIEQDADAVLFLYRHAYYYPDNKDVQDRAEVIISKNRSGPTGTIDLRWVGYLTRFYDETRARPLGAKVDR